MLETKRYLYVGFMAHQSIEKILKAYFVEISAHTDSDMDVAVIVDELKVDYFTTRPLLWKIRREIDDRIEPILLEKNSDESGFISEIIEHGIII